MKFWFGKKETETDAVPEKAEASTVFSTSAESADGTQTVTSDAPSIASAAESIASAMPSVAQVSSAPAPVPAV